MNVTIDPKSVSLFIATPTYNGAISVQYTYSLVETADTLARAGVRWRPSLFCGTSLLPVSRAILTAKFMASGYSHILFIDSDVSWSSKAITNLLGASTIHEMCCGVYPKKCNPLAFPANPMVVDGGPVVHPETGFWELKDACTGFLMIRRSAIERMIAKYPERKAIFRDNTPEDEAPWEYNLFDTFVDSDGRYLSEDFGFSRLYQGAGGRIWADPNLALKHHGYAAYDGKLADLLEQ